MINFDITIVVVLILAYIIAYLLDKVEVWSITLLFFVIYFLFTQISFDASEVGFDFTIDYYIKIGTTQLYNYITDLFGVDKVLIYPKINFLLMRLKHFKKN